MINVDTIVLTLWGDIIQQTVTLLQKHPQFFPAAHKKTLVHDFPPSIAEYMIGTTEAHYLKDLYSFFTNKKLTPFTTALIDYLTKDFASLVDKLPPDFIWLSEKQKNEQLAQLDCSGSELDVLRNYFTQEIDRAIEKTVQMYQADKKIIYIQSARSLPVSLRAEVRSHYQDSFVSFQANKSLLGGLKIFINGQVIDNSWVGKLQQWSTLALSS